MKLAEVLRFFLPLLIVVAHFTTSPAQMERVSGPINSLFFEEGMPFLQMLRDTMRAEEETEEDEEQLEPQFTPYPQETNLQLLLRLEDQHRSGRRKPEAEQHESCVSNASGSRSDAKGAHAAAKEPPMRGRKRRKRPRVAAAVASKKKAVEAENQRMNHIAVERNRRRLMNDHLGVLKSLMPASFIHRGDQASIVGGAIDFVKELEQHLLSLQAEKWVRTESPPPEDPFHGGLLVAPQYVSYSTSRRRGAEEGADVEATVVEGHVNLKVLGRRRAGQLVRAVAAMEELRLAVLHLNVTSLDAASILYSLNLKMEDGCQLGSADEIATAVHQIFTYINAS